MYKVLEPITFVLAYQTDCLGDQINKNELGTVCSTYEGEEGCIQDFGGET
jgi:hypothetical protein